MVKQLITKGDLVKQGLKDATAQKVIAQAKKNLVAKGYTFYENRRLGAVPSSAVEAILNVKL